MKPEQQEQATEQRDESKDELIERLLAKAELDFKCCGGHCSSFVCDGERG